MRLTDEDFRRLAEIEEHHEVARWDIPAFGAVERAFAAFKKSIGNISETEDEIMLMCVGMKDQINTLFIITPPGRFVRGNNALNKLILENNNTKRPVGKFHTQRETLQKD